VVAREGVLTGHNTDATGFATAYRAMNRSDGGAPVAIIGAGGVGKAIGFALAGCGVTRLRLFDVDPAKCQALAAQLSGRAQVEIAASVEAAVADAAGIVNGSPIGMLPNRDTPVPAGLIQQSQWVADAVYHPLWTPLLKAAQKAGATVMTGRELSIHQAVDGFTLFTGQTASYSAIAEAFDRALAAQEAIDHAA
jgi:shikimate dehydrogenase